jgi:L-serine dehydratase
VPEHFPSIFNDVIGPVMRGPSSSHCAAALRIGRMARDLMDGRIDEIRVELDPHGSLATTHTSQGSDMGLFGGLLGWEATDERLAQSAEWAARAGIRASIEIVEIGASHPNTYQLTLKNDSDIHRLTALSTGGGMIEVIKLDGHLLSMGGDYYETLVYPEADADALLAFLSSRVEADEINLLKGGDTPIIEIKSQAFLNPELITELKANFPIRLIKSIAPVLPVLSRRGLRVPFITCQEMLDYNRDKNLAFWELALHYESARGNISQAQAFEQMQAITGLLQGSIAQGLRGTQYADRILGNQSRQFRAGMDDRRLLDTGMLNRIMLYVSALMEVKSSLGVFVAAPTAGSCGGLPGAVIGAADEMGLSQDEMTRAMLAAGLVGVFIAAHATFAAEVGGCQAECGSGSGMAAAALATLANGTLEQCLAATSLALQNILGMICDPVANRVEAPCLGKNILAASNGLACANLALAGYDPLIPLDQVIETMDRVGKSLPAELRCTGLGGLSITAASKAIEEKLHEPGPSGEGAENF